MLIYDNCFCLATEVPPYSETKIFWENRIFANIGKCSEQSLVWWLDAHQADIDRGLTAVVGLVLQCFEQPRIAGVCDIAHARYLAIFAWIQTFYILKGNVIAFTYIINDRILALRGGAFFDVAVGPIDFFTIMPVELLARRPVYLFTSGDHVQEDIVPGEVQHLLREAADTVDWPEGIFVGRHSVEVVECVCFRPLPILDELRLDLITGDGLGRCARSQAGEGNEGEISDYFFYRRVTHSSSVWDINVP